MPIASNLTNVIDCNGMGVAKGNLLQAGLSAAIFGDIANDRAELNFYSVLNLVAFTQMISFQYEVK